MTFLLVLKGNSDDHLLWWERHIQYILNTLSKLPPPLKVEVFLQLTHPIPLLSSCPRILSVLPSLCILPRMHLVYSSKWFGFWFKRPNFFCGEPQGPNSLQKTSNGCHQATICFPKFSGPWAGIRYEFIWPERNEGLRKLDFEKPPIKMIGQKS